MTSLQLMPGLWYLGSIHRDLRTYGAVSYKDSGAMYNSYLMDIGDGFAVFGSVPQADLQEWIGRIGRIICAENKGTLRYAVLFGTNRDREAAAALLQQYPEITLIGDMNTFARLEGLTEEPFRRVVVRLKRTIALGSRKLYFHPIQEKYATPSLYVMDIDNKVLFTADAFGSDIADENILSSNADPDSYLKAAGKYYRDIFGEKRQRTMKDAVGLAENNGIRMICPSEGLVADSVLHSLYDIYLPKTDGSESGSEAGSERFESSSETCSERSESRSAKAMEAALIFAPGGHVRELAACIRAGIEDAGGLHKDHGTDACITVKGADAGITVKICCLDEMNTEEAVQIAERADALIIGTPSIRGDAAKPVWDVLTSLRKDTAGGKQAAVFSSYHAATDAVVNVKQRLSMIGCEIYMRDLEVQGTPDAAALKNAYEFGYGIGCSVLKIPNDRQPALVRCLVCGEIFDASLGICPVCGVGLEQCVPVDEEEVSYRKDTQNSYVIVGGGIAGVSAAEAIRKRDKTGRILMISAEQTLPVNRPMLTKDMTVAAQEPETLLIHPAQWYEKKNIEILTGMSVTEICPKEKTVKYTEIEENRGIPAESDLKEPDCVNYDRLVYAAGAECFIPPFKGSEKENVLTIRHLTDSARLGKLLDSAEKAVVIGGGVLGLEAANEIMRAGVEVTVLEAAPRIIGRQADSDSAAILKSIMEDLGVSCHEGVAIDEIVGDAKAEGVKLSGGEIFKADFVVVSCGNRANTGPLKQAGAKVERAVVVDEHMRTSIPDIFACGDCCQFEGLNYQLWQEASSQGSIAGANAAGDNLIYANQMLGLSLEGFGTSLFALGDPGKDPGRNYRTIVTTDTVANRHERYWYDGGALQGCVVIGAQEKIPELTDAVRTHRRYEDS